MLNRVVCSLILVSVFLLPSRAEAIENGEIALGENVATFILKDSLSGQYSLPTCSGAVIAPRIVVTAKHCIKGYNSLITWLIDDRFEVTYPGMDVKSSDLRTAKILGFVANPGEATTRDDIALVILDREFPVIGNVKIPTVEELDSLKKAKTKTITLGYGTSASSNLQSFIPYKITNVLDPDMSFLNGGPEVFAIKYLSPDSYICGGDSGGPNFAIRGDVMFYVGATGFATRPGCAKGLVGNFYSGGTSLSYNNHLLLKAEEIVKSLELEELKAKQEAEAKAAADKAAAELKAKQEAEAKAAAELKAKQEAEAKAAAELKAKQEAEAKAKAEAAKKRTTITCVKGKTVKKVTAVNPKCPVGFRKK